MIKKKDKRSQPFTEKEKELLLEYVDGFTSVEAAATKLGLTRNALDIIKGRGSCHPNTYKILSRKVFKQVA